MYGFDYSRSVTLGDHTLRLDKCISRSIHFKINSDYSYLYNSFHVRVAQKPIQKLNFSKLPNLSGKT